MKSKGLECSPSTSVSFVDNCQYKLQNHTKHMKSRSEAIVWQLRSITMQTVKIGEGRVVKED